MPNVQLDHSQHQAKAARYPLCLLAHDIDVPMNVGGLFRIADAFGVEEIFLSGSSAVPPNSKIRKTSRSTEKYVPFTRADDPLEVVATLRARDYRIISLEITSSSIDIRDMSISGDEKICLILGSESSGVSQALLDASDETVHIPMLGHNSSMNVTTACAIATFEIIRKFLP